MHDKLTKEMVYRRAEATSCGCLGNVYHALCEQESAITCFQRCTELATEAGEKTALTAAEVNIGLVFESKNDFKNALIKKSYGAKNCSRNW